MASSGQIETEEALEELAVVTDSEVEQLVDDHVVLEKGWLRQQPLREGQPPLRGAGCPLAGHFANLDLRRLDLDTLGPRRDSVAKLAAVFVYLEESADHSCVARRISSAKSSIFFPLVSRRIDL